LVKGEAMRSKRFRTLNREEILFGPALSTMAKIGGPAVLSSLLFTLYNLADAFWIGRLPQDQAGAVVAGIQVSWPLVWFLISFVSGFGGAAVSALVAQYIGADRPREANFALNQLFTVSLVAGVVLGIAGFFLSSWVLSLLLVREPAVAREAALYLKVILLGLPTMLLPGLFYFAFSATGDTITPLLVNGVGILLNMALDPLLVLGWGAVPQMGILGAAYATVVAQGVATVIFLFLFRRGKEPLRLDLKAIAPRWAWMKKALRIGFPAAIGQSSMAFGFVIVTAVIGRLENAEVALAGYGIGDRVLGILFIATDGLSVGLTTMVGQALGAGRLDRARELVRKGLLALLIILVVEAALLWLLRNPLVGLFIPGRTDVIREGARFIELFAVGMPFLGTFFAAQAIYRGAGHNVPTMILGILRLWVLRIPLAYVLAFPLGMQANGVWWGMSLSNVIAGLVALGFLGGRGWQRSVIESTESVDAAVS
jgi:putative MATE family efflux protein